MDDYLPHCREIADGRSPPDSVPISQVSFSSS
jgi:hypothetical protein